MFTSYCIFSNWCSVGFVFSVDNFASNCNFLIGYPIPIIIIPANSVMNTQNPYSSIDISQTKIELRKAIHDFSERGLLNSAKWFHFLNNRLISKGSQNNSLGFVNVKKNEIQVFSIDYIVYSCRIQCLLNITQYYKMNEKSLIHLLLQKHYSIWKNIIDVLFIYKKLIPANQVN